MKEQEKQPAGQAPADDGSETSARAGDKFNGKPFSSFDLPADVLSSLDAMGISNCTPIQEKVMEPILGGGDIIGKAETGTGKTIGFGAPLVAKIETQRVAVQGLVLTPTRELAQQVAEVIEALGKDRDLQVVLLVGGVHASGQIAKLRKGSQVVVGTPGRVLDLLKGGTLSLGWCETVVLDEADRMLDMGFIDEVGAILNKIPKERQTLLFSATIPQGMQKLLGRYMTDPKTYSTSKGLATVPDIHQGFISLPVHKKLSALRWILDDNPDDTAIIFCNTKRQVIDLDRTLWGNNYSAGSLHGDQTQDIRFAIMDKFRAGDIKVLVATDVASRGLDIPAVTRVINYDVPEESESYVHRIGRTGRANRTGIAITLVAPKERRYWEQVLKDTKFKIASLDRQEGRPMGNTSSREGGSSRQGDGSGGRGDGSEKKPRRQRRKRGRKSKDGEQGREGGGGSGERRKQGSSGPSSRGGGGEGKRSRRGKSSRGRRGKRPGGGRKLPKMDPEFENKEEMEEAIASFKEQDDEKRQRQQSRPAKLTFEVVDDEYLKEDYFNLNSDVLERADAETDKQKKEEKAERDKRRGGEGRRRRRRRSRSGGGGGGGGRRKGGGRPGGGEKSGGEQARGEKQSGEGSRRRRRPRRRKRRGGGGGGGSGGGGGGGGGSGGGGNSGSGGGNS
ncbi:MAG: DEAD/DEAH box helicase [Planctomycetota bacterium]|nr:DEAD/DEAH box helicase [Planctomycetota bacterium]